MRVFKVHWVRISGVVLGALLGALASAQTPNQLIQSAFANRQSCKAARIQLDAAKRTASFQSAYPATRIEFADPSQPEVQGGEDLTLFQPIDVFGKTGALRAGARASVKTAEANYRQALLDVQQQVLTAYANWANATRTLKAAQDQLEIAQAVEKATKVRVEARNLPEVENIRAELETQRSEQAVADDQAAVDSSLVKLNQAAGQTVSGDPVGLDPSVLVAPATERDRPELLNLFAEKSGFDAERKQADLSVLPDLELQARRSPWSEQERYGIQLQVVLPLWDHGAARNRAAAAKKNGAATDLELTDTRNRIQAELTAADIQLSAAQKSMAAYVRLVAGARELVTKTQRGFMLGAATLVEVYDAKRVLNDTLTGQSSAQFNLDMAVAASLSARGQLLGGGL